MYCPTTIQPEPEIARCETKLAGPCRHGLGFPVMGQEVGVSFVLALLKRSRPATRLRAVVVGGLDAINRVSRAWLWPHVSQEISEAAKPAPSVAHRYSLRSVFSIVFIGFAVAAGLNSFPTVIPVWADQFPLLQDSFGILPGDAAARSDMIEAEMVGVGLFGVSALALAKPARVAPFVWDAVKHGQFVVFLPSQVEFLRIHVFLVDGLVTNKMSDTGYELVNI